MSLRDKFVKSELEKICIKLDECYDKVIITSMENDNRFLKIFEVIVELSEKTSNFEQLLKERLIGELI